MLQNIVNIKQRLLLLEEWVLSPNLVLPFHLKPIPEA